MDTKISLDVTKMLKLAERRDALRKIPVECPECKSKQVQLTSWFDTCVHYKCRKCKHAFTIARI